MLTPYLPYPLVSGGQTRSYNLLKNLADKHDITLFSLIKDKEEKRYVPELEKFCKKVFVFNRSKNPWTLRNVLLTGFSAYPFLVIRNLSREEKRFVTSELNREKYDLIHAETFYVMPHIPKTKIPILLVEQTVEYLVYKHYVQDQASLLLRPVLWIDIAKLWFWETYFWKRANKVVAMSEADKKAMRELVPELEVDIVPNGIDERYFSLKKNLGDGKKRILYVGNFKWLQNREAVQLLATFIWPKIKQRISNSKLWICGTAVTDDIRSLASDNVEVVEGMPDIRDAYNSSDVLVAPIKGPGGTRLKILEAMASGVPVVTTKVGIEGLGVVDGKHVLVRDSHDGLVNAAIQILEDKVLAQNLAREARKLVVEKYSWKVSAQRLDDIYQSLTIKR